MKPGTAAQREQAAEANYVHTFGPNLLLTLIDSYSRYSMAALPANFGKNIATEIGIPGVNTGSETSGLTAITVSGYRGLGDLSTEPLIYHENYFQEIGSIVYVRGNHSIKVGGAVIRRQSAVFQGSSPRGAFSFNANFTNDPSGATPNSGNAMASLLLGYPASTSQGITLVQPEYLYIESSAYVQDDWRVTQ